MYAHMYVGAQMCMCAYIWKTEVKLRYYSERNGN